MKVKQLTMKNFRGFDDLTIDFEPNKPTIFVGVNGVGKSSILDCLLILLSSAISDSTNYKLYVKSKDMKNDCKLMEIQIKALIDAELKEWSENKDRQQSDYSRNKNNKEAYLIKKKIEEKMINDKNVPVIVHYPIHRTFSMVILNSKREYDLLHDRSGIYKDALSKEQSNFNSLFKWYELGEDVENEKIRKDRSYEHPFLKSLRNVIYTFLEEFSEWEVQRFNREKSDSPRMVITKKGQELELTQLSEGERCILAIVGDLARRLILANPTLSNPLEGEGIVLIDEIELHLHPQWQRSIIKNLTKTFPNCQFIITTHSPQVISEVRQVHLLHETEEGKIICDRVPTYGKDSNIILETLMGTVRRSQDIQDDLDRLFELIGDENIAEAKALKAKIEDTVGTTIPELARADWAIADLEIMQEEDETDS